MKHSILTIDPGTRHWGVSVFHGRDLNTCMVKNLSAKDSSRNRLLEARKIFIGLCGDYTPDLLVIEKPYIFWKNQSTHLRRIIGEIKSLARCKRMRVVEFSPKTVRKVLCQDERATKGTIAEIIGRYYPELKPCLEFGQKYNNRYWWRMVNSTALGICYMKSKNNCKIAP